LFHPLNHHCWRQNRSRIARRAGGMILFAMLLSGCSYFFPEKDDQKAFAQHILKDHTFPRVHFDAEMTIIGDTSYDSYFKSIPKTLNKDVLPPTSNNALLYRAEMDLKILRKALKNKGYFHGDASYKITSIEGVKKIDFTLRTGEQYHIGGVSIVIDDQQNKEANKEGGHGALLWPEKAEKVINIQVGEPVQMDKILESMARLYKYFQGKGYFCVDIPEPLGKIDDVHKTLTLEYKIILNGKKKFGSIDISGLESVSKIFVLNRLHLKSGAPYNAIKLDKVQRDLLNTELFSSINITPALPKDSCGIQDEVPLKIELLEAPQRSVGAGFRYATEEGLGGKLYWEHRNLWGGGERFRAQVEGGQWEIFSFLYFEKPDFYWADFSLESKLEFSKERTIAFSGYVYNTYLGIKHRYDDKFTYQFGNRYEYSRLKQGKTEKNSYVYFPLLLSYDQSNDVLNPYKGWRVKLEGTPFIGDIGDHSQMYKVALFGADYLRLIKKDQLVLATWGRVGHLFSTSLLNVPLNQRFYSGGINSVRGYGYQKLGPISPNRKPTGGKSQWEAGIEPRLRVGESLGFSVFFEGGQVFSPGSPRHAVKTPQSRKHKPVKKGEILFGFGAGVKYYTDIGPLRLDVAFPTKIRKVHHKKYDAPFQLYVSIGQSF